MKCKTQCGMFATVIGLVRELYFSDVFNKGVKYTYTLLKQHFNVMRHTIACQQQMAVPLHIVCNCCNGYQHCRLSIA